MRNNRRFDKNLVLSESQVIDSTSDVPTTNEIDLGAGGFGEGDRVDGIVDVEANSGGITIKVAHSDDAITTLAALGASTTEFIAQSFVIADAQVGKVPFTLPQDIKQHVRIFMTADTSGTVSSRLTAL